ncbi:hypothetical protein [Streptomyces sp. NPDC050504]|uniref:hypothetical protein n=1 Tax=Streptomyces sp. NPDC050504 TaxID=3365618 RepID=UPI0037AAC023
MPKTSITPDVLQRLARVERELAALQRQGAVKDELPFYPTSYRGFPYEDGTSFVTLWETVLTPRTASLSIGLVLIGDQVSATNTGGAWQILLDGVTVAASGSVPATFTLTYPTAVIDLTPYRAAAQLKVQLQVRRTSGASTGGKFGGGGSIGGAPTYARLI